MGQKYLADGKSVSMRLWDGEGPSDPKPEARRVLLLHLCWHL